MRTSQKANQPKTFEGQACRVCGNTQRYTSNNNCVACKHRHNIETPYDYNSKWGVKWARQHPDYMQIHYVNSRAKRCGVPGIITESEWLTVKEVFDYTCLSCGKHEDELSGRFKRLTVDHVIPITDSHCVNLISNIQPLFFSCNCSKGANYEDFRFE